MSNNGYGYFTPPPSPDYYRVGPGISELQKLDPITLYNFLNISKIPEVYQYLQTKYGVCQDAIFNPNDKSLVYKNQSGQWFYIELNCDNRGVCHFIDKATSASFVFQKPDFSPLNWDLINQLQQQNQRRGGKMKKSMRRKSLRKRKTLRRRKIYK